MSRHPRAGRTPRGIRTPFWLHRLLGKLQLPPVAQVTALGRAIDGVDALFTAKGEHLVRGPGHADYVLGSSALDLAAQLRRLAAELRRADRHIPRLDRPRHGLPARDAIDDAAARLVAMADYLETGQARHNRRLREEVERLLGICE